jgi:predicted nucleic acid-binding protein
MILLDTNVLTRMTDSANPNCAPARRAIQVLPAQGERVAIVPQNLYEFWAVATRKAGLPPIGQNGLGMSPDQASLWLGFFQRRFSLLSDQEELFPRWHALVKSRGVRGLKAHDARLVAAMQCYGITQLLTFNADDFKPFSITLIDPASF